MEEHKDCIPVSEVAAGGVRGVLELLRGPGTEATSEQILCASVSGEIRRFLELRGLDHKVDVLVYPRSLPDLDKD